MTLIDFLSRTKVHNSSPHEIISKSFDIQEVLQKTYYIQTRPGTQKVGITVGKIYGHDKPFLPHIKYDLSGLVVLIQINQS